MAAPAAHRRRACPCPRFAGAYFHEPFACTTRGRSRPNPRQRYLDCTCPWTVICRAGQLNEVTNRNGMFAVPTVPAGFSTPTVPPAGCCAHTRGELARRFPSPRSCALTPTLLQVLATELPRPHPTPAPPSPATACRATLSLAQLSRSTLSLNSLDSHARTHAAPRTPTSLTATAP